LNLFPFDVPVATFRVLLLPVLNIHKDQGDMRTTTPGAKPRALLCPGFFPQEKP